ncbi:unnamed protein product [Rotaria sp. Silwood2]|nr:unnamed protein product [Rotaria sp. Silwood2]
MDSDDKELNFSEKLLVRDIADLAETYIDEYLKRIGFMTAQTSHKLAAVFINGDYEEFSSDLRGGKHIDSFYDMFPEIETDAKAFVVEACSRKSADLKVSDLAQFIDTNCRLDLRRWGAKFEANSQRPYFEGHERDDVVKHRNQFINYFIIHKDFYYTVTDGETPTWKMPTQKPYRILICKWSNRSFKGRDRSHMVSDFLVEHLSGPFFELSENEWKHAVLKYKSLNVDCDVNYVHQTATASINIGTDAYFDNDTFLGQFERLFQMLEFKQDYEDNQIETIVDNARTHATEACSSQDFGKSIGTRCPVE